LSIYNSNDFVKDAAKFGLSDEARSGDLSYRLLALDVSPPAKIHVFPFSSLFEPPTIFFVSHESSGNDGEVKACLEHLGKLDTGKLQARRKGER
jgi:hypothetical protein